MKEWEKGKINKYPGLDRLESGKVRARYRDRDGKQHWQTFEPNEVKKADAWRKEQMADVRRGSHVAPVSGRTTFKEFVEDWKAGQSHTSPATRKKVESVLRRHLVPYFGDRRLESIRRTEVAAFVAHLINVENLSPATVHLIYGYFATIMRAAVKDRLLHETPCVDIRLPEIEQAKVKPLKPEDVVRLIDATPDRYKALVILAAGTGLRQGECFGLTLQHVDFLRKSLAVELQLNSEGGPLALTSRLKTKSSRRTVPLPNLVVEALAAHVAAFPVTHPDGLLFTTTYGNPIRRTSWTEAVWWPACKRANLPGLGFHTLRHTYASLLIEHGESVKVVQERLGHKSAMETLDTYGHIWDDQQDETRNAVDEAFARVTDVSGTATPSNVTSL